jgi:hypothetical protein
VLAAQGDLVSDVVEAVGVHEGAGREAVATAAEVDRAGIAQDHAKQFGLG